ncbi:MAG: UDP-N-acetylmuramoyl-tripeptide--D-alanyl-D-alanine ligase [Microbacteriaceae bacterium]|nr:UDP-N-acetylmuramoyl-tripeptide--D-alanyl-D-alanine ligase [Microbacteriaceae bacterium]
MLKSLVSEIAADIAGRVVSGGDKEISGTVRTNSLLVRSGDVFVALRGSQTDGHKFIADAITRGASLIIAEECDYEAPAVILVKDSLQALSVFGSANVRKAREGGMKVYAVTGSNGKTTTKNMLAAILSEVGDTVFPENSFNNLVGAPLTMLKVDENTKFLSLEFGANRLGTIAKLAASATPDTAIVLKVGLSHVGEFGSIEQVRLAKAELAQAVSHRGFLILNGDDPLVTTMDVLTTAKVYRFGLDSSNDFWADNVESSISGTSFTVHFPTGATLPVQLRILGEHHVYNALAALAATYVNGIDPALAIRALEGMPRAARWRMELLPAQGFTVINDGYNASPDSMSAALRTLAHLGRSGHRTIALLGGMANLGDESYEEHDRIGRLVVRLNISKLFVVGELGKGIHNAATHEGSWDGESEWVADNEEAIKIIQATVQPGDIVLTKGSNILKLWEVGDKLAGVVD